MWSSHSTRHLSGGTWSTVTVLVPTIQKRHGQTGEGPEEDCEDDLRAGEPALWGKTEGFSSFHPGEEKVQGTQFSGT